ncbi:hypothetical protein LTR85_007318 [Meristemomyces frigidus]|nr:hypothetical protein LTR85_007318 [Meristemomyces frigidus]
MPGALKQWPTWPEFTKDKGEAEKEFAQYKKDIAEQYGEAALRQSWVKVCKKLESLTDEIAEKGTSMIPVIPFDEIKDLSPEKRAELQSVGCFVVRGVVDRPTADEWFQNAKTYVADNRSSITGWPAETPFVLKLYWSPTQLAARTHPNHLALQRELNSWWHDASNSTSPDPLSYADGIRIRPPKVSFYGLGPHIDAGSLTRWVDPAYRKVYHKIWEGKPEEHDAYDLELRKDADQAIFGGSAHSSVFRAYQGWTALTESGPQEGSLLLYPDVQTVIAYLLLRPFFQPPKDEAEIMDATKWTFDVSDTWFPGTWRDDSQMLSPSSHPHLRLQECMVNIPRMYPGDTVWWHCDMCHAVEVEHHGQHDSSVVYVAATPTTPTNALYMKAQLHDFLAGRAPEDFKRSGSDESGYKGFLGEKSILSGEEGRRAMGFGLTV